MVGGLPNKNIWNIEYEDLVFGEVIGKGNFGLVFRGNYLGVEVAIKQIPSFDDPDYCKYTEREVKALRYIRHPYIVHFFGACHHSSGFYLITEYIEDQDLRRFIKTSLKSNHSKPIKWSTRISISLSIAKTFLFLHSKNILHRDLKSKNVLLEFGRGNRNVSTKLIDFGFTRIGSQYSNGDDSSSSEEEDDNDNDNDKKGNHLGPQQVDNSYKDDEVYKYNGNGKSTKLRLRRMSICGTISFMAPEVLLQQKYDWSVDVYSFGIILAELITLKRPGKDFWVRNPINGFDINIDELKSLTLPDTPDAYIDLCLKCCSYQSNHRPTFSNIINILENIQISQEQQLNNLTKSLSNTELNNISKDDKDNNNILIQSIGQFKERKRQSINDIFQNKFSLRTSNNNNNINNINNINNNNNNNNIERECIIKFSNSNWKSNLLNIDLMENVWVVYRSLDDRIEMTISRIQKSFKNSLYLIINDNNMVNGIDIISIKPYSKEFPHIINSNNNNSDEDIESIEMNEKRSALSISLQVLAKSWIVRKRYSEFKNNWNQDSSSEQRKQWVLLTNQFIQSEIDYKKQLDMILKSYLDPLKSKFRMNKPLLNLKEINAIFSNIELISELNNEFLKVTQQMESTLIYSSSVTLSDLIIKYSQQMKSIYGNYTFNFKYAMNILAWCKLNPDFQAYLDRIRKSQFKDYEEYDLTSLLSVPINKIQKYLLNFEKLVHVTPSTHYEYKNLSIAFSTIKDISTHVQNQLELSLEPSQIQSIETMLLNIKSQLAQNGRWFIKQGSFEEVSKKQQYYIFLLSDICLITKPIKSKSTLDSSLNKKYSYRISHTVPLKEENISMKLNPDLATGIILTIPNKTFKFNLSSEDDVGDWLNEFERTLILVYRNNIVDHSKSLEDIYNNSNSSGSNSGSPNNPSPLSLSNNNLETPKFEKGFIKRFRQSISGSPDRRASLLNLQNNNNNNTPLLKSTLSVANFQTTNNNNSNLNNISNIPTTPNHQNNQNNPTSESKKNKLKSLTNKLKRLSVTFSTSPINEAKKKEFSRE